MKERPAKPRIVYIAEVCARLNIEDNENTIPTRQSLLSRLKDWGDHESWKDFFDTYWRLIYRTATRAGLTDAEAQDVVQETVISVMKKMPDFRYDVEKGSFKGWLLKLTKWRISDQLRKRQRGVEGRSQSFEASAQPDALGNVTGPGDPALEAAWEEEWEGNIWEAAIGRVKRKVASKDFQIFDLHVCKEWPVSKVAQTLNVSQGRVYLTKHRIGKLLKKEVTHLRTKPI